MKHNLKISVSDEGTTGLVRCKKTSIREKFLRFLFGESRRVTVIIPGDVVSELSITEARKGGENEENAELIQWAMIAFVVALFMTFVLLVYMFNSFTKPAIVLYSIFTALLWVNIGLWITWNPYSMSFAIWFISLIGVIVNTAIFLVDRINENTKKWVWLVESIIEAGQARFKPIIISTLTTILWIWSSVTQDEFYAWLWYTVIFGLLFSSLITLVAVPMLYYSVFRDKDPWDQRSIFIRIKEKLYWWLYLIQQKIKSQ